jgi:hypothetical protein
MLTERVITYKNLRIVQSQFFTNFLIFVYIRRNSKIFRFTGIQIQLIQ